MSQKPIEMLPVGGSTTSAGASSSAKFPPPPYRHDPAPGGLGQGYRKAEDLAKATVRPTESSLDATSYFALAAAGWYSFAALLLILLPSLILYLAGTGPRQLSTLEVFLTRLLGLGLLALAALCLFVIAPAYHATRSPGRNAAVLTLAILGAVTSIISWNVPLGALATISMLGNGFIGGWAAWALAFGTEDHHFNKYLKKNSRLKRL